MVVPIAVLNLMACVSAAECAVVPAPVSLTRDSGEFSLNDETQVIFWNGNKEAEAAAEYLAGALRPATGYRFPVSGAGGGGTNTIFLKIADIGFGPEGYRLVVIPDRAIIIASTGAGLFYGVQTLRQLLPPAIFSETRVEGQDWQLPAVTINDYPRFAWRGMMLDPARHFLPKEFVKKFIDTLALHKMNRLHLHLTDDQGWRIEIKKYPKLTEVGAWREETLAGHFDNKPQVFDGKRHGGFYSQEDIRELVAYAAERHITIMPEIEMPGHAQAAIASYSELGNLNTPLPVHTKWGVNKNIFNVEESTILFLQDVLAEVVDLFPSTYIHIGGDEAVKDQWKESAAVQKRMAELGLPDEDHLQSYFIARMNDFLKSKNRRLIGWDEILEGGLGKDASVMAWRGVEKGIIAAQAGNDVVMAPTAYTYFDYYQGPRKAEPLAIGGNLPLHKVYSFDPVPKALDDEAMKHILGAQGQLWGEYIATPEHAEYMGFPRACALAEVVWTPQSQRNYEDFLKRLKTHLERLGQMGVRFRELDN